MTKASKTTPARALLDTEVNKVSRRHRLATLRALTKSKEPGVATTSAEDLGLPEIPAPLRGEQGVGDINLLITDIPIVAAPFADIVHTLVTEMIRRVGGLMPELGVHEVKWADTATPYQVARWEMPGLISVEMLHTISRLVAEAYETDINAYKLSGTLSWGKEAKPLDFTGARLHAGTLGIYFGTKYNYSAGANGVCVYQQFKHAAEAQYLKREWPLEFLSLRPRADGKTTTSVELRDHGKGQNLSGLGQDSFIMLVVQISYLLRANEILPTQPLMTTVYRALNRIGTRAINRAELYGMSTVLNVVERTMLLPLQRPSEAARFGLVPESVLLVGVPGVGKTFLEHYLMAGTYNAIFVAVDSDKVQSDLNALKLGKPSETLTRADRITKKTGLPLILIIDDIDVILKERPNDDVVSKFLNLMQGIRQKGLYVLASTNYPETLDPRLLEPGRLSKVVHVKLPDEAERKGVLMTYLRKHPFADEATRDEVAHWAAGATAGWTQRFLWELTLEGARSCLERNAEAPTLDDYQSGHQALLASRNFREVHEWDGRIAQFVSSTQRPIGFARE